MIHHPPEALRIVFLPNEISLELQSIIKHQQQNCV